jgi:hypothetical protein
LLARPTLEWLARMRKSMVGGVRHTAVDSGGSRAQKLAAAGGAPAIEAEQGADKWATGDF